MNDNTTEKDEEEKLPPADTSTGWLPHVQARFTVRCALAVSSTFCADERNSLKKKKKMAVFVLQLRVNRRVVVGAAKAN